MSNYAFTDIQSMLYGLYIFEADTEKRTYPQYFTMEKRTVSSYCVPQWQRKHIRENNLFAHLYADICGAPKDGGRPDL